MSAAPTWVLPGSPRHGVAIYAQRVAGLLRPLRDDLRISGFDRLDDGPAHVQFTDRLWGSTPEEAAERFRRFASGRVTTVTLHDVPQPSDGPEGFGRRTACYAAVVAAAAGIVCSSDHEARLLREHVDPAARAAVIPLPLAPSPEALRPAPRASVGLLGYFYPGKGHAEVLAAMGSAGLAGSVAIEVLGGASPGHEPELQRFADDARDQGFEIEVCGYLADAELLARSRAVGVPVIAHQHISASGSLNSWLEAGRRPVALRSRYTEEMERRRPGTLALTTPDRLGAAIAGADPASTWQAAAVRPEETARAYLDWWKRMAA